MAALLREAQHGLLNGEELFTFSCSDFGTQTHQTIARANGLVRRHR